jgi:hypothetical protein
MVFLIGKVNTQLLLDNFLETVLEPDKETINYYGVEVPFPSLAQAELDRQFNLNLENNVSPIEFEKVINNTIINIKLKLNKKNKYYYFLLYNICHLKKNKFDFNKGDKLNLNKLLFAPEGDIIKYYDKIRQLSFN